MASEYLTIDEAAAVVHCKPVTIRRALHRGEMPMYKISKNVLIKRVHFNAWVDSKQLAPATDRRLLKALHPEVKRFLERTKAA